MAFIRRRDRKDGHTSWAVNYTIDGRQSSMTFTDELGPHAEADAIKFRNLVEVVGPRRALEMSGYRDTQPAPMGPTVSEWLEHHITHLTGVEKKTLAEYRRYAERDINPVLGNIPLSSLSRADVSEWLNAMAGAAGKTISNKHGFLSGALKRAVKEGAISGNPCEGIRLPRTEKAEMIFLSHEEYRLLNGCFTDHYKPLVEFLVASGARFSEAAALTPADVDRKAGTVRINKAWKHVPRQGWERGAPKTTKSTRTIDVSPAVLDGLDYSREWLFVNTAGNPVRIYGWRENVWYPAVKKARNKGLEKKPRVHDLRHTCASWMVAAKVPLPVIQRHLGHESIKTTIDVYGHLDREDSRTAAVAIAAALHGG